jgi:hypothetical protein
MSGSAWTAVHFGSGLGVVQEFKGCRPEFCADWRSPVFACEEGNDAFLPNPTHCSPAMLGVTSCR